VKDKDDGSGKDEIESFWDWGSDERKMEYSKTPAAARKPAMNAYGTRRQVGSHEASRSQEEKRARQLKRRSFRVTAMTVVPG